MCVCVWKISRIVDKPKHKQPTKSLMLWRNLWINKDKILLNLFQFIRFSTYFSHFVGFFQSVISLYIYIYIYIYIYYIGIHTYTWHTRHISLRCRIWMGSDYCWYFRIFCIDLYMWSFTVIQLCYHFTIILEWIGTLIHIIVSSFSVSMFAHIAITDCLHAHISYTFSDMTYILINSFDIDFNWRNLFCGFEELLYCKANRLFLQTMSTRKERKKKMFSSIHKKYTTILFFSSFELKENHS